jgi:hypothetical protein
VQPTVIGLEEGRSAREKNSLPGFSGSRNAS